MTRLFVAIEIPPEVKAVLAALPRRISGAKWVHDDAIHLTLQFLGEAGDELFAETRRALAEVRAAPFRMVLRGGGTFPRSSRPRVLWVGVERSPELMALQRAVELALEAIGYRPEERAYHPHITIARLKNTRPAQVAEYLEALKAVELPAVDVDRFLLFSSRLEPERAVHRVEEELLLRI